MIRLRRVRKPTSPRPNRTRGDGEVVPQGDHAAASLPAGRWRSAPMVATSSSVPASSTASRWSVYSSVAEVARRSGPATRPRRRAAAPRRGACGVRPSPRPRPASRRRAGCCRPRRTSSVQLADARRPASSTALGLRSSRQDAGSPASRQSAPAAADRPGRCSSRRRRPTSLELVLAASKYSMRSSRPPVRSSVELLVGRVELRDGVGQRLPLVGGQHRRRQRLAARRRAAAVGGVGCRCVR